MITYKLESNGKINLAKRYSANRDLFSIWLKPVNLSAKLNLVNRDYIVWERTQRFSQTLEVLWLVSRLPTNHWYRPATNNCTCEVSQMTGVTSPVGNVGQIHQSCRTVFMTIVIRPMMLHCLMCSFIFYFIPLTQSINDWSLVLTHYQQYLLGSGFRIYFGIFHKKKI